MAWRAAELSLFTPSAKLPIKVQSTIAERDPFLSLWDPKRASGSRAVAIATIKSVHLGKV